MARLLNLLKSVVNALFAAFSTVCLETVEIEGHQVIEIHLSNGHNSVGGVLTLSANVDHKSSCGSQNNH